MRLYQRVELCLLLAMLLLVTGASWAAPPVRDGDPGTIGACLSLPDGTSVTLPGEQVIWCGKSGKSFGIKEWFEKYPTEPRLVVVSYRPLPVSKFWNVDVTGVLATLEGVREDGRAITQRAIIASPRDVSVYCDPRGRPYLFLPIKQRSISWLNKRSLLELSGGVTAGAVTMDEGSLPLMPDSPDSLVPPVYCATIAETRAQYSPSSRVLVELQCRPLENPVSGQFTLKEDGSSDTIAVYYAKPVQATDRINKLVGAIQKDASSNYWIEVDSGPNWLTGYVKGRVDKAAAGTIAWLKTLPNEFVFESTLEDKVVSRVFPLQGYFYIQERRDEGAKTPAGILVSYPVALDPGDVISIEPDWFATRVTTVDGERAIADPWQITVTSSIDPPGPLGINERVFGGGPFNVFTPGPVGGVGLNNVGLLVRVLGKVTSVAPGYFYLDDGSTVTDGSYTEGAANVGVRVVGYASNDYAPAVGTT